MRKTPLDPQATLGIELTDISRRVITLAAHRLSRRIPQHEVAVANVRGTDHNLADNTGLCGHGGGCAAVGLKRRNRKLHARDGRAHAHTAALARGFDSFKVNCGDRKALGHAVGRIRVRVREHIA